MLNTRGLIITLEGIDGCGKSTQLRLLEESLKLNAVPYIAVREPGGTTVGEDIRQVLLHNNYHLTLQTEMLLYMAARSELIERVIIPALMSGKLVVCDRFTDSTLAYQGYGGGANINMIRYLNKKVTAGISPNLTFLLDLSVEEAALRRGSETDRMEKMDICYHRRVRRGFLEIARSEPQRVIVIDAKKNAEEQGRIIWHHLEAMLNEGPFLRIDHEL